jgi:hypothetical protein
VKVLTLKQFMGMPAGTVYVDLENASDALAIKGKNSGDNDWMCVGSLCGIDANSNMEAAAIIEKAHGEDLSVPLDLYTQGRDGLYDIERTLLVFEPHDIDALIERLQRAKAGLDDY